MNVFSTFIKSLLSTFNLEPKILEYLTSADGIEVYRAAFTHPSALENSENSEAIDYEFYEQLGDVTISKFIVTYCYQTFPLLRNKDGVKIVARIRIKYASKTFLADLSERLGFWEHIRISKTVETSLNRLHILEDVFEAFIGATEIIVDNFMPSLGYICCYSILSTLYKLVPIIITYNNLFDAKTRLKELCDFFKKELQISYCIDYPNRKPKLQVENFILLRNSVGSVNLVNLVNVIITRTFEDGRTKILARVSAQTKSEAEQIAAEKVLTELGSQGFSRPIPAEFSKLNVAAATTKKMA